MTHKLDARGLKCPLPLLKLKQKLNSMQVNEQLEVLTTDSGSIRDFDAFTRQVGHLILEQVEKDGEYHFLIEKLV